MSKNNFETLIADVEKGIKKLEDSATSLEELLETYENTMNSIKEAEKLLTEFEGKLEVIKENLK